MSLVSKVLLLHDIDIGVGTGMLSRGSRYLLSKDVLDQGLNLAIQSKVNFESLDNSNNNESVVRVTIDDGGSSCIHLGELLAEKNIKAHFFIVSSLLNTKGFINHSGLKTLNNLGHVIGSHSHTHPGPFCELSYQQILDEVKISKSIIEDCIGKEVNSFAVPGGEVRLENLQQLSEKRLGLQEIYTSLPLQGAYSNFMDPVCYGRLCIESYMSSESISNYCKGKGWKLKLFDYQLRRLRRELIYKFNKMKF